MTLPLEITRGPDTGGVQFKVAEPFDGHDGKGAKGGDVMTKTHAMGAAVTYGRRYLLGMIFNIAVGEDTDGNPPKKSASAECLAELIEEREARFYWNVEQPQ